MYSLELKALFAVECNFDFTLRLLAKLYFISGDVLNPESEGQAQSHRKHFYFAETKERKLQAHAFDIDFQKSYFSLIFIYIFSCPEQLNR